MIEFVGFIAAILTTSSFLPQAIKTIATRDTSGISIWMYSIFVTGVSFWLVYGVLLENKIIVIANVITLILSGIILAVKMININSGKE